MHRRLRGLAVSLTLTSLLLLTPAPGVWAAPAAGQLQRLKRIRSLWDLQKNVKGFLQYFKSFVASKGSMPGA